MNFSLELEAQNIAFQSNYSLISHNAFRIHSVAEFFCSPSNIEEFRTILQIANYSGIPITILGGGSNVVVPLRKIKGLVLCTTKLVSVTLEKDVVSIESGCLVRNACVYLANRGKQCIEFLYGMPGSLGGACWMNARCYDREISEVLLSVEGLSFKGDDWSYKIKKKDFSYKKSPFQKKDIVITKCRLQVTDGEQSMLWQQMVSHEFDRRSKGHYLAPCAGSVFKNNRDFGMSSGALLDALGFRGQVHGGAMVNPVHANIIINTGNATAKDIYELSADMQKKVKEIYGHHLEHEVQFLGEREQWQLN